MGLLPAVTHRCRQRRSVKAWRATFPRSRGAPMLTPVPGADGADTLQLQGFGIRLESGDCTNAIQFVLEKMMCTNASATD
jgi:hypothetical protein